MILNSENRGKSVFDWEATERAVAAIAGPQTLRILAELGDGAQRYNTLARATALDHKSLSRRLARLERAGLVTRNVDPGPPLQVCYHLTSRAESLLPALETLGHRWRPDH